MRFTELGPRPKPVRVPERDDPFERSPEEELVSSKTSTRLNPPTLWFVRDPAPKLPPQRDMPSLPVLLLPGDCGGAGAEVLLGISVGTPADRFSRMESANQL